MSIDRRTTAGRTRGQKELGSAVAAAAAAGRWKVGVFKGETVSNDGECVSSTSEKKKKERKKPRRAGELQECCHLGGRGQLRERERDNVRATYLDDKSIYNPAATCPSGNGQRQLSSPSLHRIPHGVRIPMCDWSGQSPQGIVLAQRDYAESIRGSSQQGMYPIKRVRTTWLVICIICYPPGVYILYELWLQHPIYSLYICDAYRLICWTSAAAPTPTLCDRDALSNNNHRQRTGRCLQSEKGNFDEGKQIQFFL